MLYASPTAPERSLSYVDLGQVRNVDVGFREIHWTSVRATEVVRAQNWSLRVSIYAPTPVTFGISRMYQQLFGGQEFADVFVSEDRQVALDWLGLSDIPAPLRATPA